MLVTLYHKIILQHTYVKVFLRIFMRNKNNNHIGIEIAPALHYKLTVFERVNNLLTNLIEAKRDQLLMHRRGALHGTKSCFTPSCATARFIQNKKTKL